MRDLKYSNRALEDRLLKLSQLQSLPQMGEQAAPSFGGNESQVRDLESKLSLLSGKYATHKEQNIRFEAEVQLLKQRLIESEAECEGLSKRVARADAQKDTRSALLERLAKDPALLNEVVAEVECRGSQRKSMYEKVGPEDYERVLMEKQDLARELREAQAKMKAFE